jgi:hypothetical protein
LSYLESELQNIIADYDDLKNQLKIYENKDNFEQDSDIVNAYSSYKTCLESVIGGLSDSDFIDVPDNFEICQQD